jgi:hypothetical protein
MFAKQPSDAKKQLGPGKPLDAGTRGRMERGLGADLAHVRVHTGADAARTAASIGADGLAFGPHVALGPAAPRPGTLLGDALLAHELAHTLQQRHAAESDDAVRTGPSPEHELDAHRAAAGVLLGRPARGPRLRSGLRLALTSCTPAPPVMNTPEEKATWIDQAVRADDIGMSRAVVGVFATAQTQQEFDGIQRRLNMDRIVDALDDWDLVVLGALGPLRAGADRLNRQRAQAIVDASHDFGIDRGQVFAAFIFNNATTDDIEEVLGHLAADRRMHSTIERMPQVQAILRSRGIDLSRYRDPSAPWRNFGRGVATGIGDFLGSSEAAKGARGSRYFGMSTALPEPYQKALTAIDAAEFQRALAPSNVVLGTADYLTFGIVGGAVGLVSSTVRGVRDLTAGETEQAGEELTGAIILILSFVGVRAVRAARGAAIRHGIRLPGFPEPITEAQAILGRRFALAGEGAAGGGALLERLGTQGVLDVAGYVQARSAAALFVAEGGLAAAEALSLSRGNVRVGRALLESRRASAPAPAGTPPPVAAPVPAMTAAQRLWVGGLSPASANRAVAILAEAGLEGRATTLTAAEARGLLRTEQAVASGAVEAAAAELDALGSLSAAERASVGSAVSRMNNRPDLPTVRRTGAPSGVRATSNRPQEAPYHPPADMIRVEPRQPLALNQLDTGPTTPHRGPAAYATRGPTYLWVVDEQGVVRIARENQPGYVWREPSGATTTRPVKHGDLTPSPAEPGAAAGATRGPARAGGELYWAVDARTGRGRWVLDNNSSYSFNRADRGLGTDANLGAVRELLRNAGTDVRSLEIRNILDERQ